MRGNTILDYEAIADFYRTELGIEKESTVRLLAENTKYRKRKKGEQILSAGDRMTVAEILLSGVGRVYMFDDEGHEVVIGFWKDKGGVCVGASGLKDRVMFNVDAVTDMDMLEVPIPIVLYAIKQDPTTVEISHRLLGKIHDASYEWQIVRQTKKGLDRYKWFLEHYSDIADEIAQKDIASFLGVQPPSLSRLKAKLEQES